MHTYQYTFITKVTPANYTKTPVSKRHYNLKLTLLNYKGPLQK